MTPNVLNNSRLTFRYLIMGSTKVKAFLNCKSISEVNILRLKVNAIPTYEQHRNIQNANTGWFDPENDASEWLKTGNIHI